MPLLMIESSLNYLNSPAALASLQRDAYYPKWHSPWWHMMLLHEMGETQRIPEAPIRALIQEFQHPITTEFVDGADYYCHCALGCAYQLLHARGLDVDAIAPWIRPWLLRYQMADGGLNCDPDAYQVEHECPSSMVGTISAFEAILRCTDRPYTAQEVNFLDRAAHFLCQRRLLLGSATEHNAEERQQAHTWIQLAFPRFYFYDVLRGLRALLEYARRFQKTIEFHSVRTVWEQLQQDRSIRRQAYLAVPNTTLFPLLEHVSANGPSAYLEQQWQECQALASYIR